MPKNQVFAPPHDHLRPIKILEPILVLLYVKKRQPISFFVTFDSLMFRNAEQTYHFLQSEFIKYSIFFTTLNIHSVLYQRSFKAACYLSKFLLHRCVVPNYYQELHNFLTFLPLTSFCERSCHEPSIKLICVQTPT